MHTLAGGDEMSRRFWQGIALGTAAVGLATLMTARTRRRRLTVADRAGRAAREGGRLVQRGAVAVMDCSRSLGRRLIPKAVR